MYRISGTFLIWRVGGFVLNRQTEVTANIIFRFTLWKYLMAILGQSDKLNVRQSLLSNRQT